MNQHQLLSPVALHCLLTSHGSSLCCPRRSQKPSQGIVCIQIKRSPNCHTQRLCTLLTLILRSRRFPPPQSCYNPMALYCELKFLLGVGRGCSCLGVSAESNDELHGHRELKCCGPKPKLSSAIFSPGASHLLPNLIYGT